MILLGFKKIDSIKRLDEIGLNIHNTVITNNIELAIQTVISYSIFSVRTDTYDYSNIAWGDGQDLPFYFQDEAVSNFQVLKYKELFQRLIEAGFYLIISDGQKYDTVQSYNAVLDIKRNGDFRIEASTKKVPLRMMYKLDGLFYVQGNIADKIRDMQWFKVQEYSKHDIVQDIQEIYTYGVYNRELEFTRYPVNVGKNQKRFAFWQIR